MFKKIIMTIPLVVGVATDALPITLKDNFQGKHDIFFQRSPRNIKKQMIFNEQETLLSLFNELGPRFFNSKGQRCLTTLKGHTSWVHSVAVDPRTGNIVSGSDDGTIIVWDAKNNYKKLVHLSHTSWVHSVAVDPRTGNIVSGSDDGTIIVWDAKNDYKKRVLRGHTRWITSVWLTQVWVTSVAVDPLTGNIVSGSSDGNIIVWDVKNNYKKRVLKGHTSWVRSVVVDPLTGNIFSGSSDGTVIVWDASKNYQRSVLRSHTSWVTLVWPTDVRVRSVAVDPRTGKIVSGSDGGTIIVCDLSGFLNGFNKLSFKQVELIIKLQTQRMNKKNQVLSKHYKKNFNNLPGVIKNIFKPEFE